MITSAVKGRRDEKEEKEKEKIEKKRKYAQKWKKRENRNKKKWSTANERWRKRSKRRNCIHLYLFSIARSRTYASTLLYPFPSNYLYVQISTNVSTYPPLCIRLCPTDLQSLKLHILQVWNVMTLTALRIFPSAHESSPSHTLKIECPWRSFLHQG